MESASGERGLRVAVVGATGLVGREVVSLLAERRFPVAELRLYASDRTAGEEVDFGDDTRRAERLPRELPEVDLAFLCAPAEVSRELAEDLVASGAAVVDLSAAHRTDAGTPLVVAGSVTAVRAADGGVLVAVPDASVLLLMPPLRAIASLAPLRRVIATALVSASVFGRRQVDALGRASAALLGGGDPEEDESEPPLAFSALPAEAGTEDSRGRGVAGDVRRLLGLEAPVTVRFVRVPVFHGHGASISVETAAPVSVEQVRAALREAPSILLDEPEGPATGTRDAIGSEGIHVGALRIDSADPSWLHFWVAADNIRQGAALNAVSVAEALTHRSGGS